MALEGGMQVGGLRRKAGVDFAHRSRIERGERTPSVNLIVHMASITDGAVTQEEILRFATSDTKWRS
jgi:transcriptional regulator with XRE-family HTH domain